MSNFQALFWLAVVLAVCVFMAFTALSRQKITQRRWEAEEQRRREEWIRKENEWRSQF